MNHQPVGAVSSKAKGGLLSESVEQQCLRRLPHAGVPEIVSRLQPECSTSGVREVFERHHCYSQLCEDGVGG